MQRVAAARTARKDGERVRQYVEHRDGGYRVVGTRMTLESIVSAFLEGQTAESSARAFPVPCLEQTNS